MRYIINTKGIGNQFLIPSNFISNFSGNISVLYNGEQVQADIFRRGFFNFTEESENITTSGFQINKDSEGLCVELFSKFNVLIDNLVYETKIGEADPTTISIPITNSNIDEIIQLSIVISPKSGSLNTIYFYKNGSLVQTNDLELNEISNFINFIIGSQERKNFFGEVSELRVWRGYRDSSLINKYRYRNLSGKESDLVAYYRMDKNSGKLLSSYSRYDRDAKLNSDNTANFTDDSILVTLPFNLKENDTLIIANGESFPIIEKTIDDNLVTIDNIEPSNYTPELDYTFMDHNIKNTNYNSGEDELKYHVGDVWISETFFKGNEDLYNILQSVFDSEQYRTKYDGNAVLSTIYQIEWYNNEYLKRYYRLDNDDDDIFSIFEIQRAKEYEFKKGYDLRSDSALLYVMFYDDRLKKENERRLDNDDDDIISILYYTDYLKDQYKKDYGKYSPSEDTYNITIHDKQLFLEAKWYRKTDNDDDDILSVIDYLDVQNREYKKYYGKYSPSEDILNFIEKNVDRLRNKLTDNDDDDILSVIDYLDVQNREYKKYYGKYSPSEDILSYLDLYRKDIRKRLLNNDNDDIFTVKLYQDYLEEQYKREYGRYVPSEDVYSVIREDEYQDRIRRRNITKDLMYFIMAEIYGYYSIFIVDVDFHYQYYMDINIDVSHDDYKISVEVI